MHAVMFYFLFSKFYKQTYSKRDDKVEDSGKTKKSNNVGICFTTQTALYEKADDVKSMKNGYTSAEGNARLRNRAFIDSAKA